MSTTVFIWDPNADAFGHAAMQIDSGPYISWWPNPTPPSGKAGGIRNMFGSYAYVNSMKGDRASEGRAPSWASAPIKNLDEAAMQLWWTKFSGCPKGKERGEFQTNSRYNVLTTSCSGVVFNAMVAGGLHKSFLASAIASSCGGIISPPDVKEIAAALSGEIGFFDTTRFLGLNAVIPSDVRDVARVFAR